MNNKNVKYFWNDKNERKEIEAFEYDENNDIIILYDINNEVIIKLDESYEWNNFENTTDDEILDYLIEEYEQYEYLGERK